MTQGEALVLTLLVEMPVLAGCLRLVPTPRSLGWALFVSALSSLLSHPLAWAASRHLAWRLSADQALHGWLLIETAVVLFEAVALKLGLRWSWRASLLVSMSCNGASASLGLLLRRGVDGG